MIKIIVHQILKNKYFVNGENDFSILFFFQKCLILFLENIFLSITKKNKNPDKIKKKMADIFEISTLSDQKEKINENRFARAFLCIHF